jgi:hypothetical protein
MIRAAFGGDRRLGQREGLGSGVEVELRRDIARELEMLFLVVTDGNVRRLIEQHVGRLQHRIGVKADARAFAVLARFFLELRHAVEPADARGAEQQPCELGMRGDASLVEQDRLGRIDPGRHQRRRHLARVRGQLGGIVIDGDRVEIGEEIEFLARHLVLHAHPVADRAQIIAEMQISGGLDAR